MQQEHVLSELFRHIEEMTATKECCTSDSNTLQFLEACNKIFENGFLSHSRVVSMDSEVLKSIDEGYQFFSNWLKEVQIKKGSSFNYADPNKEFLAWQTVETLFSQYKYNAGGKLDAVNYATARAASLVKQVVSSHHCSKDYKDQPLQTTELPLNRKQYQKKA
uniref:Uncharacterized protein n=1 Tax=Amphimedon queenslandica TaxID=400682 RepID=A0A1X7UL55_AMPQE